MGRLADIGRLIDRSLSLTPQSGTPHMPGEVMENIARELRAHGHPEEARQMASRAVDWYRGRNRERALRRFHEEGLARALYLAGRWQESRVIFAELANAAPRDLGYATYLGCIAARMNDSAGAGVILDSLVPKPGHGVVWPSADAVALYGRSRIAALLGQTQRAVDLLREAIGRGVPYGIDLHNEPDFEPLRDDAAFKELTQPSE